MEIRRLSEDGVGRFRRYLAEAREGGSDEPPWDILQNQDTSVAVSKAPVLDQTMVFDTKGDVALYLSDALESLDNTTIYGHQGLWSWLALFYYEQLCPADSGGLRSVRADEFYVFQPDYQVSDYRRLYRHLLYMPFHITKDHKGELARALLCGTVSTHGDMMEQIGSRQNLVSSKSVLEAVDILYLDKDAPKDRLRSGATNRNRHGNVRRFASVVLQLDATYDLHALSGSQLVDLLPDEFSFFA